jgi:2-polyprenyl-6-methoxyphenol hydroxylase-like FAD-dependent oxidoreductase
VRGRDASERVRRVISFTGQSLAGPDSARSILTFSPRAEDLMVGFGQAREDVPKDRRKSAAGRSQMLALRFGRGRVVVLGEAAMFSAQLAGPGGRVKMGMNYPGIDNRQLALNTLRWLARVPR